MKQIELAQQLGISKSYLAHLEQPLSELVHKSQFQKVPSNQRVVGSNPARDATLRSSHAYTTLKSLTEKPGISAERATALPNNHTQESNSRHLLIQC